MTRHVALLRGINVGGGNRLPMADLRSAAEGLGWQSVRTHIASGNLVFEVQGAPDALAAALSDALKTSCGLTPRIIVQTAAAFRKTLDACPFKPEDLRHAHVFWLLDKPAFDKDLLAALRAGSECLALGPDAAYLHAPDGIGRSALANKIDKVLGTATTGRNLRTARAIAALLD
ncbi:MAG: DUF1697 domain-containing protein [Pseudooceanicola sp.]|nr:DUF1697 domain-containing protein [Pseudooceanicola sp.]